MNTKEKIEKPDWIEKAQKEREAMIKVTDILRPFDALGRAKILDFATINLDMEDQEILDRDE